MIAIYKKKGSKENIAKQLIQLHTNWEPMLDDVTFAKSSSFVAIDCSL